MNSFWHDVRYGIRMLIKKPGFTGVALIALALGIGANTAIFSIVNALLLRDLPYPNSDRLVMLWETNSEAQLGFDLLPASIANYIDWRNQCQSFEAISILDPSDNARFDLTGLGIPERVEGAGVSASFFEVMGTAPALGRSFSTEEDQPGGNTVVVISHALWQKRFAGDPDILGKTMQLNGKSYAVIGVMPPGFQFPRAEDLPPYFQMPPQTEIWTPIALTAKQMANRASHNRVVLARLKQEVTLTQSQAEVSAMASALAKQIPEASGWGATVVPMKEQLVGNLRLALLVMLAAVGLVLLIACANVANLLLARAAARQREIAVRTALGASRLRIVRQLLTESLLLSLAGGVLGVLLAVWGIDLLLALSPASIPRKYEVRLDGYVLGFTFAVSLVTGVLFGLAPAFQMSRLDLSKTFKEGGRGSTGSHTRIRSLLVVGEIALSLVLLIGAGLLVKSFARITGTDPGFNPNNVAAMYITLSSSRYDDDEKQVRFFKQVLAKVKGLNGISSVGAVSDLPLSGAEEVDQFTVEGSPGPRNYNDTPLADFRFADQGYFSTLEIRLVAGRYFTEHDNEIAPPVVIVSESLARRFFADENPVGKRIKAGDFSSRAPWATIVGLVNDVKHSALDAEVRPQLYFPFQQKLWGHMTIVARAAGGAQGLFAAMRGTVWEVDKDQPIGSIKTLEEHFDNAVAQRRFNATLLGAFGIVALALAAVGIFGVMSYAVSERTHEIGVRMALGAQTSNVLALVVKQGMKLALVGVGIGLGAALALTRVMASLLYGVSATDPLTFAAIAVLLSSVALLACYLPARRAAKVDPMIALRYE